MLQEQGVEPEIVLYLQTPPDEKALAKLLRKLNMSAHALLRQREADYKTLGLSVDDSEAQLIKAMVSHPKLIERPIAENADHAVVGRPPENVLDLLS